MNASMRFIDFGAMLLGTALGGIVGEIWGARQALIFAVVAMFAAAVYLAFTPVARLRTMPVSADTAPERLPEAVAPGS